MSVLSIRLYKKEDHADVLHLHRVALQAIEGAWSDSGKWDSDLQDIGASYIAQKGIFIVGCLEDKIVAMGAFRPLQSNTATIKRMRVLPEFQGKGYGKAILKYLEDEAYRQGYRRFLLDTTVKQKVAIAMYTKYGYREFRRVTMGFPLETIFFEKYVS